MDTSDIISILSAGISAISVVISCVSMAVARRTAMEIKAKDTNLERKKFVATLWDRMAQVRSIDPANPNEADVQQALTTLELVAVCWVNDLVDQTMILIVFGDIFVLRTREISRVPKLPVIQRSGEDLLQKDYPLVLRVEAEIQKRLTAHKTMGGSS